jgi:hypothetical protein
MTTPDRYGTSERRDVSHAATSDRSDGSVRSKQSQEQRPRTGHLAAALLFGILTLIFFWPAMTGGAPFSVARGTQTTIYRWAATANGPAVYEVQSDQALISYPWDASLKSAVDQGTLAFWSAGTFDGGYPLYANGSSAELYPPRLLLAWAASPEHALAWYSALSLFLAGLFAYAFARSLGMRWFGGALAGVSWMFASFNIAWLPFGVIAPVMVLLPLDLLLVRRACQRPTWGSTALAGCAIGFTFMAGHLLYMGLTILIALGYGGCLALSSAVRGWRRERWRACRSFLVPAQASVVGVGIGAITLLPTLDAFSQIDRSLIPYSDLSHNSSPYLPTLAPPSALFHAIVPLSGSLTISSINLDLAFAGTLTACLAIIGVVSRRPGSGLGVVLVVLGGLGAIGGPVTWLLYHSNPLMQVENAYGRLFEWWAFGLAVLGGLGLDLLLAWLGTRQIGNRLTLSFRRTGFTLSWLVLTVGGSVVAVTAVQPISVAGSLTQAFDAHGQSRAFPSTPLISAIQKFQHQEPWPARVMLVTNGTLSPGTTLFQPMMDGNIPQVFDIDQAGGYDSTVPGRVLNLQRVLGGASVVAVLSEPVRGALLSLFYPTSLRYDLLERTGVGAIVAPPATQFGDRLSGDRTIYSGKDGRLIEIDPSAAEPRIVNRAEVVDTPGEALSAFVDPRFEYTRMVILERSQLERLPPSDHTVSGGRSIVRTTQVGTNSLTLSGYSTGSGWMVIPENWDPGWSAVVNGRPTVLLRGNYTQQVLRLTGGKFVVQLAYHAPGFRLGAVISAATVCVVFGLVGAEERRRRRTRRPALIKHSGTTRPPT